MVERAVAGMLDGDAAVDRSRARLRHRPFHAALAPSVASVTAVDASPEVIEINRGRVAAANVRYVEADLFAFEPETRYDCVFMSFWLSHVPHARFEASGRWCGARSRRAASRMSIDSAHDPTSTAADHPTPDRHAGVVTRRLDDGREFRIVKVFYEPEALATRLQRLGFEARIAQSPRYFVYGDVRVPGTDRGARATRSRIGFRAGT